MKKLPSIIVPIISNDKVTNENIFNILIDKKVIIFGVPGAFTPTCSEQHFPSFLKYFNQIKDCGIDDVYCLSVNDPYVMKSWLITYNNANKIKGISDGNGEISKKLNLLVDKSSNFMGFRCTRFSMIVANNIIKYIFLEEPGKYDQTSAENILKYI